MRRPAYLRILLMLAASVCTLPGTGAFGLQSDDRRADSENSPVLVATGDFNRDGIADLVQVSASNPPSIAVLLGRSDGSFARLEPRELPGENPTAIVVGDFNGDSNPDVIVGESDGALLELLGNGSGGLSSPAQVAKLASIVSIAAGRFTHDSKIGLVVSDLRSNSAEILLGAGDGSFQITWSFELPKRGAEFHIAAADFNRDGIADLVITSEDSDDYEIMLGNGNGTFTYAPQLSHLKDPNSYCPT